jgi:hypothetical protein
LSLNRLKITNRFGFVLVSPEREEEFLAELKRRNPRIRFE